MRAESSHPPGKSAAAVARRCLCLEVLHQRFLVETDDDAISEREKVRELWLSFGAALGVTEELLAQERALLESPVGALDEDALDDLHGLASGALVFLWALGRLAEPPSFASVEAMASLLTDHGLLGDGSAAKANAAAASATLRPRDELDSARSRYERLRGKAREVTDPDRIFAEVAAHHLTWALDAEMSFDDD